MQKYMIFSKIVGFGFFTVCLEENNRVVVIQTPK
jgi:hypothetical protein